MPLVLTNGIPYTLRFLTYGSPLLETLFARALGAAPQEAGPLLRASVERPLPRVAYYALDENGCPRRLDRLVDVRAALEAAQPRARWSDAAIAEAQEALQAAVEAEWVAMAGARARLDQAQHSTQVARATRLLLQAALVETDPFFSPAPPPDGETLPIRSKAICQPLVSTSRSSRMAKSCSPNAEISRCGACRGAG